MAMDPEELERWKADYEAVTGKPVRRFVCPITLKDDPDAPLCDGHILNHAIQKAARTSVIQREDVDGRFGGTIETELIRFLNTPVAKPRELLYSGRGLTISEPSGPKM